MTKRKTILLIKSNLMIEETRRPKLVKILDNYHIISISWDRKRKTTVIGDPTPDKSHEEISLRFKAPFGIQSILFLPIWWCFLAISLIKLEWDLVHVINFDSIIPAVFVAKIKRKPIVYEILDLYIDQMVLPSWIRQIGLRIDKIFMALVNAIIIVDECQIKEISGIPNRNIITIYDTPQDVYTSNDKRYGSRNVFTLFYAGILDSARQLNLDKVFEAVKNIDDVEFIIAGYGDLTKIIESWANEFPSKIRFLGSISHTDVLKLTSDSDLLIVLRDPIVPVNKYICGSKLFEAMMCGKPLIVNRRTSTAKKVLEENCGLVVDANNIKEIEENITYLKNSKIVIKRLGINSRNAYKKKYDFLVMKNRLLSLYKDLLDNS